MVCPVRAEKTPGIWQWSVRSGSPAHRRPHTTRKDNCHWFQYFSIMKSSHVCGLLSQHRLSKWNVSDWVWLLFPFNAPIRGVVYPVASLPCPSGVRSRLRYSCICINKWLLIGLYELILFIGALYYFYRAQMKTSTFIAL